FIYLAHTGTFDDELPVQQWRQADARFTGGEAELDWALADNASGHWDLRLFGDLVRAKLADGGNLPRIAPARVGAELRWERDALRASLGAVRYMEQDRVAAFETATPGYTLVDAHVAWHADTRGGNAWELFVDGRNLLDSEARPHTSFFKLLVPLTGGGMVAGIRVFFYRGNRERGLWERRKPRIRHRGSRRSHKASFRSELRAARAEAVHFQRLRLGLE